MCDSFDNGIVPDDIEFDPGLYRGTALYYDRFRVGYPRAMVDDLLARAKLSGHGRLLDIACGTGQITFAMLRYFAEVWAVDQEHDMIEVVREKAAASGIGRVRAVVSAAEDFDAEAESFELVAIGNAFHRLRRETVAANTLRWLQPGRCLVLLWANSPWTGEEDWQKALSTTLERWKTRMGAHRRVPAGWERTRRERPDLAVLEEAGFEPVGSYRFPTDHEWTTEALIGFVYSTSFLPRAVLGDLADDFEADLRREMSGYEAAGGLRETIDFAYEFARRPI